MSTTRRSNDGLRKVCGCQRRGWAKCPHPWHFNFYWQGTPYRYSLDKLLKREVRSKTEAVIEAERLRDAIKAGTFAEPTSAPPVCPPAELTLAAFGDIFLEHCPKRRGKHRGEPRGLPDRYLLNRLVLLPGTRGPLGLMPIGTIVEADIDAALAAMRATGATSSTRNKYIQLCQSLAKWACKKGYLSRSWFTIDSDVRRDNEHGSQRHRRLTPDLTDAAGALVPGEERRLLAAAPSRLQRLIVAAIETCCRAGELLHLQWRDVGIDWLQIRAGNAKEGKAREIPISKRLGPWLEMARLDPAGRAHGLEAYVFGDELGQFAPFPYKSWDTTVLKAHGHEPVWEPGRGKLTKDSRAALVRADLHFHDLRHEGGSRLLEAGWPLHHVRDMLGHADISTTSRYLNAERHGLRESMRRSDVDRAAPVPAPHLAAGMAALNPAAFAKSLQSERRKAVENSTIDDDESDRKLLIN